MKGLSVCAQVVMMLSHEVLICSLAISQLQLLLLPLTVSHATSTPHCDTLGEDAKLCRGKVSRTCLAVQTDKINAKTK